MLFNKSRLIVATLVAILLASSSVSYGQSGRLARADDAYDKLAYSTAIELYKSALNDSEHFDAMWKLADCYRLTNQYNEAEYWYGKVTKSEEASPEHLLYYAQVLQVNEKYTEAAKWYNSYRARVPGDARADNQAKACENYRKFYEEMDRYRLEHLPFNSNVYDFSPVLFEDGLIFSSSRDSVRGVNRIHTWTGQAFFDLYYIDEILPEEGEEAEEGGDWNRPRLIKGDVNTRYHEGPLVFSPDFSKVYFTRNNYDNTRVIGKTGKSSDKVVKLKLYAADVEGTSWTNIQEFAYNNDEYSVGHAAISPDGEYLYFVSDMPGGYGGTDLYASRNIGGSWATPLNLGPSLNTEGDEMFPNIHEDGTFYFASEGHGGLGGLDVFRVNGSGTTWGDVKNMGAPLNSSADDFGLIFTRDKDQGYLTSNRDGGFGSDDIYRFFNEGITLEGIVVDIDTDKPICDADVVMAYLGEGVGERIVKCNGEFEFSVLPGRDYTLEGCAKDYNCQEVNTTTKGVKPGGTVFVKIPLKKPDPLRMEVLVVDKETRTPIHLSKVAAFNKCDQSYSNKESNEAGMSYYDKVTIGCDYHVSANAKGYLPNDADASVDGSENPVKVLIELDRIGSSIVLKNIYYDFDQSYIREEAELDLNKILSFMEVNPNAIGEIGSHTDARASFAYNEALSERRANAAVQWLIQRGVSKNRLVAVGYGEMQTVNECTDNVQCTEEEHQRNRRTEFRVIDIVEGIDEKSLPRFDMLIDPCQDCPF